MSDSKRRFALSCLKVFDIVLVVSSFGLTTALIVRAQHRISLQAFLSMRMKISDFLIFLLILLIYHMTFRATGIYRSRRLSTRSAELGDLLKAATVALGYLVGIGWLFSVRMLSPAFVALFWLITTSLLCGSRLALRAVLARARVHGRNLRYLLILGTNRRAVAFGRKIAGSPEYGLRLLGFVDDEWPGLEEFRSSGFRIVCNYAGLAEYLRHNVVDEAVIYLPYASFYRNWTEVAGLCAHHGIIVRVNFDTLGLHNGRWLTEEFDGSHYIASYTASSYGWPLALKRVLDLAVSSALILLLLPLLAVVAIAIKLTSPGPVLFRQDRVGLNKRRFTIYKFRTMVSGAEELQPALESRNEVAGPVFKIKNDPRITPLGRFLRRTSIDELPQLFNVLRGDMSLVGPRPLPMRDYQGFSEDWQRRRFSVKPGITCLWQINGRSEISFDQWMLLDLKYLDEWSLWLDLKILARTVPAVVRGSGAA